MIAIFTGLPGSGKSARTALALLRLLERNKAYYKKTGNIRHVFSNLLVNSELSTQYSDYLRYWSDPSELLLMRDCDVIWDEISTHLDATQWENLPLDIKRWLQQHRKKGVEIYGNTQTFATVDKSMRRLCSDLYLLKKLMGSPDPSPTKPTIKNIWGVSLVRRLDPQAYNEDEQQNRAYGFGLLFLSRKLIEAFDTRQEIKIGQYPPLKHIERSCIDPQCTFKRLVHH